MKQKFSIPVVRIGYGFKNIEVEANSQEEAEQLALDEAGDHEYSEKESNYEIEDSPRPKTSGELFAINRDYRSLVLNSYQSTLKDLIEAYIDDVQSQNTSDAHIGVETETDGYIDLKRRLRYKTPESDFDANLSEDIDSFHTNGTMVGIRCNGDNSDEDVTELSNEQLIEIICEMEYYISHPDEIDIH
jgi:hypothetical protein